VLSEEQILNYMSIDKNDEILFNEWAEMKKFLRRGSGRAVIVRKQNGKGIFCWQYDFTKSSFFPQQIGAGTEDMYSIMIKGCVVSFSWGRTYRFKFKSESKANECWRILNNI